MRLTTVPRMALCSGIVRRYATKVTPAAGDPSPLSFDQHRHAALGRRPGSWMALAFTLPKPTDPDLIAEAWLAVIARHGTLRTVVADDVASMDGGLGLRPVDVQPGCWEKPQPRPGESTQELLRRVFDEACCPFAAPSYALCLVEPEDPDEPASVVVGLDHCHVDAWSLMLIMRDLCACIEDLEAGREPGSKLPVALAFAEHTAALAARPPASLEVHQRWAEIMRRGDGEMPVFPLDLGDISSPREQVVEVHDVLDPAGVEAFEEYCERRQVRMISVALAEMTAVFQELAGVGLRAVLPVHSRHEERWHDSLGWFITNSVIECDEADPAACAADVKAAIRLGSHALGPILAPYGGMPHTPGMFAISWLDQRRLPVDVDLSLAPQHVSATIRTNGVMVWFVVNARGLHVRCRYPDTPQAYSCVGTWLGQLRQRLVDCAYSGAQG